MRLSRMGTVFFAGNALFLPPRYPSLTASVLYFRISLATRQHPTRMLILSERSGSKGHFRCHPERSEGSASASTCRTFAGEDGRRLVGTEGSKSPHPSL